MDDFSADYAKRSSANNASDAARYVDSVLGTDGPPQAPDFETAKMQADAAVSGQAADTMEAVAKDVGKGVVQLPRAVVKGTRDAAQETINMFSAFKNWGDSFFASDEAKFGTGAPDTNNASGGEPLATLPDIAPTEGTNTGMLFQKTAQFLAGFVGAKKILGPLKLAATAENYAAGAMSSFAAFDPHEKRLSNLVQEFPALQNPVTEFLAADPEDGQLEGRAKAALDGVLGGALTDGFLKGLRALRASRDARLAATAAEAGQVAPDKVDLSVLGDPTSTDAVVPVKPVDTGADKLAAGAEQSAGVTPEDATSGATVTATENPRLQINFATINTPDDVQRVMQGLVDANAENVDAARRGVRTWGETKLSAAQIDAWDALKARRTGEALNAEQSIAARDLWATSATKLHDVAVAAAAAPTPANLAVFRKMMATHYAIQSEVMAARAEAGRALNAWAIPSEGGQQAKALQAMIDQSGGIEVNLKLAQRIAAASEAGMPKLVDDLVSKGMWAKTSDAVAQVWINGLLSNPATHVVNAMSNTAFLLQQVYERGTAARLAQLMGAQDSVQLGESTAMMFGLTEGIKDAFRVSARGRQVLASAGGSLFKGDFKGAYGTIADNANEFGTVYQSAATGQSGYGFGGKVDARPAQGGSLSSATWGVQSDTWLGRGLDVLNAATEAPGRALTTADEFYKTLGYRMELQAQAYRKASLEVAAGTLPKEDIKSRIAELVANPDDTLKNAAVDAATYQTFTGRAAETMESLTRIADGIQSVPLLGKLLIPFKNTPINIFGATLERTPFAPMVTSWRADIAAGGARGDIAMARMATGTLTMLAAMDLAFSGRITGSGPTDPGKRSQFLREGRQAYSVKVGDKWYSYDRLSPVGSTLGMAGDIAEIMLNTDASQADIEKAFLSAVLATGNSVMNRSYMQGMATFQDAMSDPNRYGEKWFQNMAGSLVPSGMAAIARQGDPYMRVASDVIDSVKKRVPGLSKGLPLYRDLWGRPVDYRSGEGAAFDLLSPIHVKRENPEPVDKELERLQYAPLMPPKKFQLNGVPMDLTSRPDLYSEFVRLAGNDAKDPTWGMGAKDYLNAVVDHKHPDSETYWYPGMTDGPDGTRKTFLESKIRDYREMAKRELMRQSPEFNAMYELNRQKVDKARNLR